MAYKTICTAKLLLMFALARVKRKDPVTQSIYLLKEDQAQDVSCGAVSTSSLH